MISSFCFFRIHRATGLLLKKMRIHIPWPSCRIKGVADFYGHLNENEIFLKIRVPISVTIQCSKCKISDIAPFQYRCSDIQCYAPRPHFMVYQGPCGLLKNPCLHSRSYKYFNAVYSKELDQLLDGECLLFSTKSNCKTSPVFEMSGADLVGDDFLIITQKDLLPRPDINEVVEPQNFDDQGEHKEADYIDNEMVAQYFLDFSLKENTIELAQLHSAFSEHHEEGIGHPDCLLIAKYHSYALDFAKTGKAAVFPKDSGIPSHEEIVSRQLTVFPSFQAIHRKYKKFNSQQIKGRLYEFLRDKVPRHYLNKSKFCEEYAVRPFDPNLPTEPILEKCDVEHRFFLKMRHSIKSSKLKRLIENVRDLEEMEIRKRIDKVNECGHEVDQWEIAQVLFYYESRLGVLVKLGRMESVDGEREDEMESVKCEALHRNIEMESDWNRLKMRQNELIQKLIRFQFQIDRCFSAKTGDENILMETAEEEDEDENAETISSETSMDTNDCVNSTQNVW